MGVCVCLCGSKNETCPLQVRFYQDVAENSISVILTFPTFLPVNFQAAWGSLFHSSDITRGFHCLPHSSSRSLTIPPIFGSERKGIPDDDSKACAAEGILPTSVSMCVHGMSVKNVSMCTLHLCAENWVLISRIEGWGIQSGYSCMK